MAQLNWLKKARTKQITPNGDWSIWLILAGRGFGKTRTGCEDAAAYGCNNDGSRIALIGPTAADCRDTILEGESGLIACLPRECIKTYNRSIGEIILWNDSRYKTFSAEEPERLRGPQHHRAYCDEICAWTRPDTFDMMLFGLRLGKNPQVVITTTPKPTPLIKELVARAGKDVHLTHGVTKENAENLAPTFISTLLAKYEGTRLGRQELEAEILGDVVGALWKRDDIEKNRVKAAPVCSRIVVAIDPAVSTTENSDETGIVVVGIGEDKMGYVLADRSGVYTPQQWAAEAVALYRSFDADRIVGEVNNGGDLIESNLRANNANVPYKAVRATKGKFVRAEPIAALYERGRVKHVGAFPKLEDQMCMFTPDFERTKMKYSPDRLDALVWGLTDLAIEPMEGEGVLGMYRNKKAAAEAAKQK